MRSGGARSLFSPAVLLVKSTLYVHACNVDRPRVLRDDDDDDDDET